MVIGKSPFSPRGGERRARRRALRVAILAALLGFGACSPVDTWRDLTGANRNDPNPDTTPNTQNLAAGEAADYPNLATVPPPPTRAMTAAERDKLTQSLISDRANARYTAEQLRAGFPGLAAAPPPPPGSAAETENVRSAATLTGPTPAATPPSAPGLPVEAPAPAAAAALAAPAAGRAATSRAAAAPAALVAPTAEPFPTLAPAAEPPNQTKAGGTKSAGPGQGLRKQGEPPEPGPMESSLEIPQARATPQPEQIQSAPPTPQLPPTPTVAARPLSGGLAAGGALAPMSSPVTPGSAGFQPPPAPPELPPPPPTRSAAADPGKAAAKPAAPVDSPVAEIKFGADATALTDGDKKTLETVVPLFREKPGKVRIVGYAGAGGGAVEQLNSYRTALDRAHLVATALTQAGIPADKIQVEAAPAGANSGESRAEVLLER